MSIKSTGEKNHLKESNTCAAPMAMIANFCRPRTAQHGTLAQKKHTDIGTDARLAAIIS